MSAEILRMSPKNKITGKLREVGKELKDWKVTVPAVIALAGIGVGTYSMLRIERISPEKVKANTEQLIPGYNPKQFEADQQIVQSFGATINDKVVNIILSGATSINIPENVVQAGEYIKNNQVIYDKGEAIEKKVIGGQENKFLLGFAEFSLGWMTSLLAFGRMFGNRVERLRELKIKKNTTK